VPWFSLLLILAFPSQPPEPIRIAGTVRDATGLVLPGAAIEVDGTLAALSTEDGSFEIVLTAGSRARILVSLPGFTSREELVTARPGVRLDLVLTVAGIQDRVTVTAPPPGAGVERPFTLEPIQIYRTPGVQADVFRALQALPGVAAPDESAGLFVRGGDVSEVLVSLDDAVIAHPYRYETPTGGFRGAVDPVLLTGLTFSTGGFSARYGNALSGVVDLHGPERPEAPEVTGTFGLAGVSTSIGVPLGRQFGVRGMVNRTLTGLLFSVNGRPRHFDPTPGGWDGSAGFGWNLGRAGRVKGVALAQRDRIGVEIEQDAFVGLLTSSSRHDFAGARWDATIGRWAAAAALGADTYARGTTVGVVGLALTDRVQSWRIDFSRPTAVGQPRQIFWRVGANGAAADTTAAGRVPLNGGDLGGVSGDTRFEVNAGDWFGGTFAEATTTAGAMSVTAGARVDRFGRAHATTVDPRLNVRVALGRLRAVRFATGLYHQAPASSYYDRIRGASSLPPMQALHYVAGYEAGRDTEGFYLRAEGYLKNYRRLPLQDAASGYLADGYGSARGLDLFGQWLSSRLELRAGASWLRARRRWTPVDQRDRYELPALPWAPDFEIPWSLQVVGNLPFPRGIGAGISWRSAAGRPHTPIVDAVRSGDRFVPVFGPLNSERFPRYERLDLSVSRLVPVGPGVAVFFASLDNALGRANFFEYAYTSDYSSRRPVVSASPRSFYIGVTFRRSA
jgi:vitamin B12 transporter